MPCRLGKTKDFPRSARKAGRFHRAKEGIWHHPKISPNPFCPELLFLLSKEGSEESSRIARFVPCSFGGIRRQNNTPREGFTVALTVTQTADRKKSAGLLLLSAVLAGHPLKGTKGLVLQPHVRWPQRINFVPRLALIIHLAGGGHVRCYFVQCYRSGQQVARASKLTRSPPYLHKR